MANLRNYFVYLFVIFLSSNFVSAQIDGQQQQQQYQQQQGQGQQQQYQQPPPPQQQQQQQYQQQPPQPGHQQQQQVNPNDPNQQVHKFADDKEIHDQQHIKSHLEGQVNVNQQMTNEQLQFHYFKMHDTNNDNMLDGVELIKAITHWHGDDKLAPPKLTEKELEDMIDQILKDDDFNNDGFIDYSEFLKAQQGRT